MKFTVLGSGTSVPHPERSSAGFFLETKNGLLLLDCSASAIQRMAQERLDWARLDAIWISHFHLDHVGGVPAFLFAIKHAGQSKSRTKPLKFFGAKGLRKLIEAFDAANNYRLLEQRFPVEIIEVEPLDKFEIFENLEAVVADTLHTPESMAIHLRSTNRNKTLVYTSDTGFTLKLGALAREVDLFVLECSFVKNKPVEMHLELAEAMHLIRYANPKRTVLTHLYPEWDRVSFPKEIRQFTPINTIIKGWDGLRLEI